MEALTEILTPHVLALPPSFLQRQISLLNVTINVDEPENGLEAMAQVITCEDIIGWRSREGVGPERGLLRVILYITDDHFHYAGEGQVSSDHVSHNQNCFSCTTPLPSPPLPSPPLQLGGIIEPYDGTCLLNRTDSETDVVEFTAWDRIVSCLISLSCEPPSIQTYLDLI